MQHIIVAGSWVASETDGTAFTEAWSDAIVACFKSFPLKFISHAEEAVKDVYIELHEGAGRVLNVSRNTLSPVQLEVVCSEQPTRLRALVHSRVESLVVVPCMVVSCSKPQYKAVSVRLLCRECGHKASVRLPTWQQSVDIPRRCGGSSEDQSCGPDQYVVVPEESTYTDLQIVKLQDPPELMDASEMPQHVQLVLPGALAGRVSPGQRLYVVGCYTSFDRNISGGGVVKSYIHGLGLCVHPDDLVRKMKTSESLASWSYEEEEVFRKLASDPNIFDMLWRSVAPAIFGLDDVKKSIVCQLFGGTSKSSPQKAKLRADINILLLGDPSTAKSHFLQFVHAVAPVCIYTSGKGSSAAGLTATIVKDRHQNFAWVAERGHTDLRAAQWCWPTEASFASTSLTK
ncbi:MAG: uncharacterized protein KVP18_002869 [Porospora cf. gigantea A]|uniref:uncharacterized protein n=1 Tax=Porospora cf. gigantea A TaxID=2853593 RepID=UPI00355A413E|nr:MAG: hypothetical protein KVP18_002869 [Porospora cf. gigantea A]